MCSGPDPGSEVSQRGLLTQSNTAATVASSGSSNVGAACSEASAVASVALHHLPRQVGGSEALCLFPGRRSQWPRPACGPRTQS